jgi:hypothetical protein
VQEPLSKEAEIIRALKIAERRAAVDANKNPIGLGWIGQPWMVPFWMWDRSALGESRCCEGSLFKLRSSHARRYGAGALYSQSQK